MTTNQPTQPASSPAPADDVQTNKVMAALSYIWILSIILLVVKKDSPFVQFHAKQGVVIFIGTIILNFIPVLGWLLNIVLLVLALMGVMNALQGKSTKLPVIANLAEQIKL